MTMIEKVAKVIVANMGCHCYPQGKEPSECPCAMLGALDAILAMREPTKEMLKAVGWQLQPLTIKTIWQAMIDAVLAEDI